MKTFLRICKQTRVIESTSDKNMKYCEIHARIGIYLMRKNWD